MDAHNLHGESSMIVLKQSQLSVGEAAESLSRNDLVSTAAPPAWPKAGKVYLFKRIVWQQNHHAIFLSYDTTFKLDDFYVSPFLFCHVLFEQTPTIPAAFVLHERKFQSIHEEFMKFIS